MGKVLRKGDNEIWKDLAEAMKDGNRRK